MHILGIPGSLRKNSYNVATIKTIQSLLPNSITMEIFYLSDIPLYNEDVFSEGFPKPVQVLRDKIAAADALIIATPEYNYSVPGVLKNAIDWASRPPSQPFNKKPIAILGASPSMLGTARAQYHLRQMFVYLNGMLLNAPEVMITAAHTKFDEKGNLLDQPTHEFLQKLLTSLVDWTEVLKP
jgi:chromate reductase, NAD(P)H dehydrogenase (quinone)